VFKKKKNFLIFLTIFLIVLIAFISYTFFVVYRGVKNNCLAAKSEFNQDCVNSLLEVVKSEDKTFRKRNSAIWALGQIADKKVLPFLYELNESLPEGEKCQHDRYLCRYEIQKAIKWCEEGNMTNWMYRNREKWK
jgi:hypothetical protein